MIKRLLATLLISGSFLLALPNAVSAAKINFSPSVVTITEGETQEVTITLDQPIICAEADPCQVSLAISSGDPDALTITTSPVVIAQNDWSQTFSFEITAVDDDLLNGDRNPTIIIETESGSEYYVGFVPSFSITILDNEIAQEAPQEDQQETSVGVTSGNATTLPATGLNQLLFILIGGLMCLVLPIYKIIRLHGPKS